MSLPRTIAALDAYDAYKRSLPPMEKLSWSKYCSALEECRKHHKAVRNAYAIDTDELDNLEAPMEVIREAAGASRK